MEVKVPECRKQSRNREAKMLDGILTWVMAKGDDGWKPGAK